MSVHQPNRQMGIKDKMEMWARHEESGSAPPAAAEADAMDQTFGTAAVPPEEPHATAPPQPEIQHPPVIQHQPQMVPLPVATPEVVMQTEITPMSAPWLQQPLGTPAPNKHAVPAPHWVQPRTPTPMAAARATCAARAPRRMSTPGDIGSLGSSGGPLEIAGKRKAPEGNIEWRQYGRLPDIVLDRDYSDIVWRSPGDEPDMYPEPPQEVPSARSIRQMNLARDEPMLAPMPMHGMLARVPLRQRDPDALGAGGPMRVGSRPPRRVHALALPPAVPHGVIIGI